MPILRKHSSNFPIFVVQPLMQGLTTPLLGLNQTPPASLATSLAKDFFLTLPFETNTLVGTLSTNPPQTTTWTHTFGASLVPKHPLHQNKLHTLHESMTTLTYQGHLSSSTPMDTTNVLNIMQGSIGQVSQIDQHRHQYPYAKSNLNTVTHFSPMGSIRQGSPCFRGFSKTKQKNTCIRITFSNLFDSCVDVGENDVCLYSARGLNVAPRRVEPSVHVFNLGVGFSFCVLPCFSLFSFASFLSFPCFCRGRNWVKIRTWNFSKVPVSFLVSVLVPVPHSCASCSLLWPCILPWGSFSLSFLPCPFSLSPCLYRRWVRVGILT